MSLLDIEPHKVSRDLRGYSVMFYGEVKSGKTTIASKFPNALLLAFEKGYSAIAGVYAKPMNSWGDLLKALRELKTSEVQEKFETIVIDTADIAWEYVEKYVCNVEGVDAIGDIPYGQGFTKTAREFDEKLRQIVLMGYGLVIISHSQDKTFQNEDGSEYNKIVPTLSNRARLITSRLCDIIGYSRQIETENGLETFLFMRGTPRYEAGSRFKYTSDKIPFTYQALVDDIGNAIDKQAEEDGDEFITDERENLHTKNQTDLDYDELMEESDALIKEMVGRNGGFFAPKIKEIIDSHLGRDKKLSETERNQAMLVDVIVSELKELTKKEAPETSE